jgi:hypothetical protein
MRILFSEAATDRYSRQRQQRRVRPRGRGGLTLCAATKCPRAGSPGYVSFGASRNTRRAAGTVTFVGGAVAVSLLEPDSDTGEGEVRAPQTMNPEP